MMPDRLMLIINPVSGQGRARWSQNHIISRLSLFGDTDVVETAKAGDANAAATRAVAEGVSRIIVAGGDGTINEVINAIPGADTALGLVPQGTGNVLARELALPIDDVEKACDIIEADATISVALGVANGRYFVAMAGIGFDAEVVERVGKDAKNILGPAAYGIAGLKALLRHKASSFILEIDGEQWETEASLVVVANVATYALKVKLTPEAVIDDGLLDVSVFEAAGSEKVAILGHAARAVLLGVHEHEPHVQRFRAKKITVTANPQVLVQLDGDVVGQTPTDIEIKPGALRVIAPRTK